MKKVGIVSWLGVLLLGGVGMAQWVPVPTPRPTATPRPIATRTPTPLPTFTPFPIATPTPTIPPTPIGTPLPTRTPTPIGTPQALEIYFSAFEYSGGLEVKNAKAGDILYIVITSPTGVTGQSQTVTLSSPNYASAVHFSAFVPGSTVRVYLNNNVIKQILLPQ